MSDVLMWQTVEGGEIDPSKLTDGPETEAYLRLHSAKNKWWGDGEKSETEEILSSLPATSGNLRRLEDAAKRDLAGIGKSVKVTASIPSLNRVKLVCDIDGIVLIFDEDWQ
jgi:hypothetical protein